MTLLNNFRKTLENAKSSEQVEAYPNTTDKIVRLAEQFQTWHKTLPLPDRWYPLQLGRTAARFNVSRELMAASLQYAGWTEKRVGTTSYWKPKI